MSIEIIYRDDYEDVADTYHIVIGAEATGSDALAAFIRAMQAAGYSNVTIYRALEEQLAQGEPHSVTVPEDEAEAAWEEFKEMLKEKMS